MKKILYSVLAILLSFLFIFNNQKTFALTDDDVLLVYVEAPEGWEAPHLWTWNEAGDSAFALLGWPGKAMIADEGNEGWFYLYIPKTMEMAILNNGLDGDDAKQTEAFALEAGNMWVTVALEDEKLVATVTTVKATTGDLPVFIDTVYIFALIPIDWDAAGIWAWSHPDGTNAFEGAAWPGVEMTLQGDGWFMIEIPATANRVIINNFQASGTEQTVDLDLLEGNNYIVVGEFDGDKFAGEVYSEKPIIIEDGLTIYVTVPSNWDEPHAWAWSHPDGTNLYPAWPGEELVYDAKENLWILIVPNWVNRIIINNKIDGVVVQTVDIDLLEGGEEFELTITEADEQGKFGFKINIKGAEDIDPDPTPDPSPTPDEKEPKSPVLWIVLGAAVLLVGVGVVLFVLKKKR